MGTYRSRELQRNRLQALGKKFERESLKLDLIRMARGDQDTPLLTPRKRASTSMTDLFNLANGSSLNDAITHKGSD